MKTALALMSALLLAGIAYSFYEWGRTVQPAPETGMRYESERYGIAFSYPEEYVLSEEVLSGSEMRERFVITLVRQDAPVPVAGEGPPAITFMMTQNSLDALSTEAWIRNSSESNFKLSASEILSPTTVAGRDALMYAWDGLYTGTTIALAQPNWVYAFSVTFMTAQDDIVRDYAEILQTVEIR